MSFVLVTLMVRRSLVPACIGTVVGLTGACPLAGMANTFLFGIQPRDGFSFAAATAVLIVVAAAATYLPARRAARIDPMIALRAE